MDKNNRWVKRMSWRLMVLLYLAAGILHFIKPGSYLSIMPQWLPWRLVLVYISGMAEILCAILLIPKKTRRTGAIGVILLLIAVFPANIQMMIGFYQDHHPYFWLTVVRLPVQLLLIWWSWSIIPKDGSGE